MIEHISGELDFWRLRMEILPHDWKSLPVIAFCARGPLELSVWTAYCSASRENAWRFYKDKFRDGIEFYEALARLLAPYPDAPNAIAQIERATAEMHALAASVGLEPLVEAYTKVAEAASAVGLGEQFRDANKLLSKIAHPSAMIVLNYLTPEHQDSLNGIAVFAKWLGIWREATAWRTLGEFCDGMLDAATEPKRE